MNMFTPLQWRARAASILAVFEQALDAGDEIPTLEEIGERLGLSLTIVHRSMERMKQEGLISWDRYRMRDTLSVMPAGDALYEEACRVTS